MKLLYDKQKLYEILKEFNNVTGVRVSFLEDHDTPIIGIPEENCALCKYKQKDESFYLKCKESDRMAFCHAENSDEFYIYECHYHLVEAIQSVKINGETLGYFLFGQVVTDKEAFLQKNRPGETEKELLAQLAVTPIEALRSYARILSWVVQYIILNNDIRINHKISFETICDYIGKHYAENLSVDFLCAEFHYSRSALFSLFKKECGLGIMEYVNDVRLKKAKELLLKHNVAEAAELVGIADGNYFCRLFKKHYGCTPSQYRSGFTNRSVLLPGHTQ